MREIGSFKQLALAIFGAFCLLGTVTTRAEDGPFGLPEPYDASRRGSVMLHGGGYGVADEIIWEFVRLAGGRDARIVLMPSDQNQRGKDDDGRPTQPESVEAYEQRLSAPKEYGRWVAMRERGQIADFQFLYRDAATDGDDKRFYDLLSKATGVWLPAYDQEWLPQGFASEYPAKISRFQLMLREVVARGGIVGGLGGGMSSLAETVIAGNAPTSEGWTKAQLRFGLALFNGAVVDQNFTSHQGRLERLTDLLRNGAKIDRLSATPGVGRRTIGLGVERQTVMILRGNVIRVLGEGRGHVFLKSNGDRTITWKTLSAGEDPFELQTSSQHHSSSQLDVSARLRESDDQDNPFGLPLPDDRREGGIVVLHGGGDTDEIIELLPQLAGIKKPRLVHCPSARESCRPAADGDPKKLANWLESEFDQWRKLETDGRIERLTFVTTSTPSHANSSDFVRPLAQANALWFCGGEQKPLDDLYVNRLEPTLFQREALNIVRRGGVVGGSSAGLAIMADIMIEGDQEEYGPTKAKLSRGLGLLKYVLAEQHFEARPGRIERLTDLLRDHKRLANFAPTIRPQRLLALAVEEDTSLLVERTQLRVTGKKSAHVFLQTGDLREIVWHTLMPGDVATVHVGPHGTMLQLEDWEFK